MCEYLPGAVLDVLLPSLLVQSAHCPTIAVANSTVVGPPLLCCYGRAPTIVIVHTIWGYPLLDTAGIPRSACQPLMTALLRDPALLWDPRYFVIYCKIPIIAIHQGVYPLETGGVPPSPIGPSLELKLFSQNRGGVPFGVPLERPLGLSSAQTQLKDISNVVDKITRHHVDHP